MNWDFKKKSSLLEDAIEQLFREMAGYDGDSEEYSKMVQQMDTLYKLKTVDAETSKVFKVTPDTVLLAAANILTVLIVVGYEQKSVLTSKALMFLRKSV